jgi:hypothetical protein
MQRKNRIFAIVLATFAATSLISGCALDNVTPNHQSISKSDITRLVAQPKISGFFMPDNLMVRVKTKSTPLHMIADIASIEAPLKTRIFSGDEVEWVPIFVNVQESFPSLKSNSFMLRLFPTMDEHNRLTNLKVGQRVLVMASLPNTDDNDLFGASLGSIFRIGEDNFIYQLDDSGDQAGKLADVLQPLGLN